jgi:hypothetical protein
MSFAQMARVVVFVQTLTAALQTGSVLQVHWPAFVAPVQL